MKKYLKENKRVGFSMLLLALIALFPLYKEAIHFSLLFIGLIGSLIFFLLEKDTVEKSELKRFIIVSIPFFVFVIPLSYSTDVHTGINILFKRALIIALPLTSLFLPSLSQKAFNKLKKIYIASASLLSIYIIVQVIIGLVRALNKGHFDGSLKTFLQSPDLYFMLRTYISKVSDIHPTYLSIVLLFSILVAVDLFFLLKQNKRISFYYFLMVLPPFLVSVLLSARTPLFAFIISLFILLYFRIEKKKIFFIITFGIIVLGSLLAVVSPNIQQRFSELSTKNAVLPTDDNLNSATIRVGIYKCSFDILKEKWLFGTGTGSLQNMLNNCYLQFNSVEFKKFDYNTHNEYLNVLLTTGIFGLILFLFSFGYFLIDTFNEKNYLMFVMIIFIGICMITENIFRRYLGNVFYSYWLMLFMLQKKAKS